MTTSVAERRAIRSNWRDHRERLGIPHPLSRNSGVEPAGLASRVEEISTRILILPADPSVNRVEFDEAFWEWWSADQRAPFGSPLPWTEHVPTMQAAASLRLRGRAWSTYLAVHRHGGIEIGTRDAYTARDQRCFRLIRTVGLAWLAFDRQAEVVERFGAIKGPWEATLVLYGTEGAHLGDIGEGWAQPHDLSWEAPRCSEPNTVIQEQLEEWPSGAEDQKALAFRFGGRIEDTWGLKFRRFLDRRGDDEGEFDARRWGL